jgi:pyrroloquinoline quinone biosynthesis protein D
MIGLESVVRLSSKARLRFDRHTNRHLLLYPERGLLLNESAADVLLACSEACAVAAIVERLIAKYGEDKRAPVTADVLVLLRELAGRGLVREVSQ